MTHIGFVLSTVFSIFLCNSIAYGFEMAVTIDDIPASGEEAPGVSRKQIVEKMVAALKKHSVPGVYGFVNGVTAENMEERKRILSFWKESGYLFGNHTYRHSDLGKVSAEEYIADIERNESLLLDYASSIEELKVFRYPYLQEGDTHEKRYAVRSYLFKRKYRIAQVSIDFEDWAWSGAYHRCLASGSSGEIEILKKAFLDQALARMKHAKELALRIYGNRPVKHILLVHMTALSAEMMDKILTEYKSAGAKFITTAAAMTEPIYREDTTFANPVGKSFLLQASESRKLVLPNLQMPLTPTQFLAQVCKPPEH